MSLHEDLKSKNLEMVQMDEEHTKDALDGIMDVLKAKCDGPIQGYMLLRVAQKVMEEEYNIDPAHVHVAVVSDTPN